MKKILIVAIILFTSISSGLAYTYQEMIYGYDEYVGKQVNINAHCSSIRIFALWTGTTNDAYGHIACGDVGANIASYTWFAKDPTSSDRYQRYIFDQYFGKVEFYLEAFRCYGEATLTWTIN